MRRPRQRGQKPRPLHERLEETLDRALEQVLRDTERRSARLERSPLEVDRAPLVSLTGVPLGSRALERGRRDQQGSAVGRRRADEEREAIGRDHARERRMRSEDDGPHGLLLRVRGRRTSRASGTLTASGRAPSPCTGSILGAARPFRLDDSDIRRAEALQEGNLRGPRMRNREDARRDRREPRGRGLGAAPASKAELTRGSRP
jgi:hypothetical protein